MIAAKNFFSPNKSACQQRYGLGELSDHTCTVYPNTSCLQPFWPINPAVRSPVTSLGPSPSLNTRSLPNSSLADRDVADESNSSNTIKVCSHQLIRIIATSVAIGSMALPEVTGCEDGHCESDAEGLCSCDEWLLLDIPTYIPTYLHVCIHNIHTSELACSYIM